MKKLSGLLIFALLFLAAACGPRGEAEQEQVTEEPVMEEAIVDPLEEVKGDEVKQEPELQIQRPAEEPQPELQLRDPKEEEEEDKTPSERREIKER
ncbi:MAG: hypothetical protein EA394_07090 [Bacteroidia bacterium]|nr:MAG: hypothetical protein EA394_07090 [Bacteroidia bacterium]